MASLQHALSVATWPESYDSGNRVRKGLKMLMASRDSHSKIFEDVGRLPYKGTFPTEQDHSDSADPELVRLLYEALRPTSFGQSFDPIVIEHLVTEAMLITKRGGSTLSLRGIDDGLYVVISGVVSVLSGPDKAKRLKVQVLAARDLIGDSEVDHLDPYCVIKFVGGSGNKQLQTHTIDDAGSHPVWNWSDSIEYDGEPQIDFVVYEDDQYSRDDVIGLGSIHSRHFVDGFDGEVELLQQPKRGRVGQTIGVAGYLHVVLSWEVPQDHLHAVPMKLRKMSLAGAPEVAIMAPKSGPLSGLKEAMDHKANLRGAKQSAREVLANSVNDEARELRSGHFFGEAGGGMKVRCLEDCEFLMVRRDHVSRCMQLVKAERNRQRDAFLRTSIPGALQVDAKALESFCACFQRFLFPRGHVFCQEGECKPRDARRVYVLRKGECKLAAVGDTPAFAGLTPEPNRVAKFSQVGLMGEGQMLGYASALFGIPEPFTAMATSETVEGYWISIGERPAASWPREITKPLMALLRMRADFHDQRTRSLANTGHKVKVRSKADEQTAHAGLKISPWLRNKNTSSLKERLMQQRFNNWTYDSSRTASQNGRPASPNREKTLPQLHDHVESVGPQSPEIARRRAMQRPHSSPSIHVPARRSPNLDCKSELAQMSKVASTRVLIKIYRDQPRLGTAPR